MTSPNKTDNPHPASTLAKINPSKMARLTSLTSLPMSSAARRLNAHLLPVGGGGALPAGTVGIPGKRLRQSAAPILNKLETRLEAWLAAVYPGEKIRAQAKRYRLANGIWYKADFSAVIAGQEWAWEAKGPKAFRGGFENLKVASATWPEVRFVLVWEEGGAWRTQEILP